jgi:hypothetical protein
MSMILALVVLCTAILAFFLQEFTHLFKKICSIPGAKILLPLFFVSLAVEHYRLWIWKIFFSLQNLLGAIISKLALILPGGKISIIMARALILLFVIFFPLPFAYFNARRKMTVSSRYWVTIVGIWLWVIFVILMSLIA